jgi:hypothetical protein
VVVSLEMFNPQSPASFFTNEIVAPDSNCPRDALFWEHDVNNSIQNPIIKLLIKILIGLVN